MKTAVDIEKLLVWAYRDELSKLQTSSAEGIWDNIADYGLHGIAPQTGDYGAAQRYSHFGLPHPDATTLAKAVTALPDMIMDWEENASSILGELMTLFFTMGGYSANYRPLRTSALVTMYARMDCRPDWREDSPRPHGVPQLMGHHAGQPSIVGKCEGRLRYSHGSYCPLQWEPSPLTVAMTRAEYVAWHHGLSLLARTAVLRDYEPMPPAAPVAPWCHEDDRWCIWEGEGDGGVAKLPLKPVRPLAGPPPRRKRRVA